MGYPYHQLIPAAIMDLNPGCTKEELVALFSAVPYVEREYPAHNLENLRFMSHMHEKVSVYDTGDWLNPIIIREKKSQNQFKQMIRQSNLVRWDLSNRPIEETTSSLATGLYGLAYLLGLSGRTPESLYAKDAFGLTLGPSHFECHAVYKDGARFLRYALESIVKYNPEQVVNQEFSVHHNEAFQTGVIINPWNSFQESTVNHLFIVDTFHGVNKEDDVISYTWSGRALIPVKATTVYYDDELKKKQPLLAPENVFDFSQTSGTFEGCGDHARWNQHGGKHYFDHDYFAFNCPNTSKFDPINISYGDFIISREAVKRKAWKLLTYRGLQHLANFHTKFPQAKAAYDTAMYGWFTSRADIFRGMTNTEYMRFRLLLPCHGDEFEPPITKAP